jgi:ribosomal protein S27AE
MTKKKMICPDCAVEMNFHAEKIDYTIRDPKAIDPDFGGILQEAHTCPECGKTTLREAE